MFTMILGLQVNKDCSKKISDKHDRQINVGSYGGCDLCDMILSCYFTEFKVIIQESVDLKGVVFYESRNVNVPYRCKVLCTGRQQK